MTFHDSPTDIPDPEVVPKAKRRKFSGCKGRVSREMLCRQPDLGEPTVRDERGGLRKRGLWESG